MKTPPLLLAAALLFWGWQSGFLIEGAAMAVILESSRFIKARWELSDDDFARIWTFCALLFLAAAVFAFFNNSGPANLAKLFETPNLNVVRIADDITVLNAIALIRWLPMIFFLFIAAQVFGPREGIALESISFFLRRRRKKTLKSGQPLPPSRSVNITYPYFVTCLFAASSHRAENNSFFWGLSALLVWALWSQRSRRFGFIVWAGALGMAILSGYFGQRGISQLERLVEQYNPQWISHFIRQKADPKETRTNIGHIGQLKLSGKIVIRLEPKNGTAVPTYLREASYRTYRSQAWLAGSSKDDFVDISQTPPNSDNWPLLPGKTNTAVVNIACYLDGINAKDHVPEGLLPLPVDCGQLEHLPAFFPLHKNSAGAVLAEGPGLVIFDAYYGSGSTIDSPPGTGSPPGTNEDLAVPDTEKPALDQVTSGLNIAGQSDEQKLLAVDRFFGSNFKYSLWQEIPKSANTNETPLGRFLLKTRSGHCEYFATATVLLLRELQIPARYVVGYAVHETSGRGYVVRLRDAHAWCLVWNKKDGVWRNFDTTPASWVAEEEKHASPLQFLSDFWSWIQFQFSKLRWGQSHLQQYTLWALVPVFGLLLYQIIFRRGRKRPRRKPGREMDEAMSWPGLDSEFYQLERKLAERGVARQPNELLSHWLSRALADPVLVDLRIPLQELLRLHYCYRFDPHGLSAEERETLRREAKVCLDRLTRANQAA